MALASTLLGLGTIGHDPVDDPSAATARQALAPLIHPGSKDAVLLSTGALQGVHPVDQAVCLAFGVQAGTLGSVPGQGHALRDLEWGGRGLDVRVRQVVAAALATLINRRDVALVSTATEPAPGGFVVTITYRNLRLPGDPSAPSAPTTLRVPVT